MLIVFMKIKQQQTWKRKAKKNFPTPASTQTHHTNKSQQNKHSTASNSIKKTSHMCGEFLPSLPVFAAVDQLAVAPGQEARKERKQEEEGRTGEKKKKKRQEKERSSAAWMRFLPSLLSSLPQAFQLQARKQEKRTGDKKEERKDRHDGTNCCIATQVTLSTYNKQSMRTVPQAYSERPLSRQVGSTELRK